LEREAGLSYLALREMLRLFFIPGFLFCRHRPEAVAAFFQALRNGSGSLAKLAAMRRPDSSSK
jgi:hypothetical protein